MQDCLLTPSRALRRLQFDPFTEGRRSNERAEALIRAGREEEAETHARLALSKSRVLENEYGPAMAMAALRSIVRSCVAQGRDHDAEPYAAELLDRSRLHLGQLHPGTLESRSHLASILLSLGRLREAEGLLEDAAATGCAHLDTLQRRAHELVHQAKSAVGSPADSSADSEPRTWLERFFAPSNAAVAAQLAARGVRSSSS